MSIFSFTADATNDQLTMAGHGLVTGDGAGLVLADAGGLAENTEYWAIRIDDDHVQLATSQANALAGNEVDITSNGSGYLGIGLPFRRARTYVPSSVDVAGAQVKSADLNALQDAVVERKMPFHWRWFHFLQGQPGEVDVSVGLELASATADSGNIGRALGDLGLTVGDVIYAMRVRLLGSAAAGNTVLTLTGWRDTASDHVDTLTIVDPPAAFATYSEILTTPRTILETQHYSMQCAFGKSGRIVASVGLAIARP